jgi:hypothetical protein
MLQHMNRWDELIGGFRADARRELLCRAAAVAHAENGTRFEPEDLGDEALIYGLSTTINARHLAGRSVEEAELEGVAVCEHGRVWWLEIQRSDGTAVRVYFYKAPPSARTVHDLCLWARHFELAPLRNLDLAPPCPTCRGLFELLRARAEGGGEGWDHAWSCSSR